MFERAHRLLEFCAFQTQHALTEKSRTGAHGEHKRSWARVVRFHYKCGFRQPLLVKYGLGFVEAGIRNHTPVQFENPRSGRLYCQCYAALAERFLKANRPLKLGQIYQTIFRICYIGPEKQSIRQLRKNVTLRYKLRPKFHAFHCQIICHAAFGAKLNIRYGSCFNEEDLVGK